MPITQNVWVIFTQYSDKQPLDLDMTDPELPDRMDQLEKTINASLKTSMPIIPIVKKHCLCITCS